MRRPPLALVQPLIRAVYTLRKTWSRIARPVTVGVRIAVFDDRGWILLVRHTYLEGWFLPGGGADRGETLVQAGARELREEAGLEAIDPPEVLTAHTWFLSGRTDHVVLLRGRAQGEPRADGIEIAEATWFALDRLPEDLSRITREQLDYLRRGG